MSDAAYISPSRKLFWGVQTADRISGFGSVVVMAVKVRRPRLSFWHGRSAFQLVGVCAVNWQRR